VIHDCVVFVSVHIVFMIVLVPEWNVQSCADHVAL
jgi:hypothetical protein